MDSVLLLYLVSVGLVSISPNGVGQKKAKVKEKVFFVELLRLPLSYLDPRYPAQPTSVPLLRLH